MGGGGGARILKLVPALMPTDVSFISGTAVALVALVALVARYTGAGITEAEGDGLHPGSARMISKTDILSPLPR